MDYQQLKNGVAVEVKGDKNFWYTVDSVKGNMVTLNFGKNGGNAGTYHSSRLSLRNKKG